MDLVVERLGGEQSFGRHVHTVAPVVGRIRGLVDLFFVGVLATQFTVGAEPVLKGKDTEH